MSDAGNLAPRPTGTSPPAERGDGPISGASPSRARIAGAYLGALLGSAALIVVKNTIPSLAPHPFLLALVTVTVVAWYGGPWPSALAALLSALGAAYYFIPPIGSFRMDAPLPLAAFVIEAAVVVAVIEKLRRSRVAIEQAAVETERQRRALVEAERQLREAHAQVEQASRRQIAAEQEARGRVEVTLRGTEEQLRQAQKMESVGRLAGGVAHDFNNLLSVILSYSQMIIEDLKPGDPIRDDLEEIKNAGDRASELTKQLLAFSRQQVLQPKILDLNDIVAGLEKMLQRLVGEDIDLTVRRTATGRVECDAGQIEQVIMNLAVNARDAMPAGGKLTIETADVELDEAYVQEHLGTSPGPHVMMAVSDSGTGMDAATRARIFEPFFTTKEKGKGTGLGLSTVYGIVQQSGGSIWLYSEPGHGTTFKIYFPRTQAAATEAPISLPVQHRRGTETLLLVEDEEQLRVLARGILRRAGYQVLEARNGGEALMICESHPRAIDLLVTDVVMPQMGGPQLAQRLAPIRPRMKVLFMSGYTDNMIVHHGVLDAGVAFLQKPLTPDVFLTKVREVIDAPGRFEAAGFAASK